MIEIFEIYFLNAQYLVVIRIQAFHISLDHATYRIKRLGQVVGHLGPPYSLVHGQLGSDFYLRINHGLLRLG